MRRPIALIALLITFPILEAEIMAAKDAADLSFCEYQETRNPIPINPKTNEPYKPGERNQEPFAGASITKEDIRQCLRAKTPIENHHIVLEDYQDAWQSLAMETGDYAISLLIEGSVIQARIPYDNEKRTGGVALWDFRDTKVTDVSKLTENAICMHFLERLRRMHEVPVVISTPPHPIPLRKRPYKRSEHS